MNEKIKFFINHCEPGVVDLAEKMRKLKIDFSSIATSGPSVLWLDGQACYGITAVKHAIQKLIEDEK